MAPISITALHDPVSIVHIPVAVAPTFSTKVYWTLDRASSDSFEFFNLTSNRIEIALFAAADLINDEWSTIDPPVRINGPWRVFEITSGDDEDHSGIYDSPHLRTVSAPLAEAGISILYQSSYFTDFLLVKSSDFNQAASIFKDKGWHLDPYANPPPRRRSILLISEMAQLTAPPVVPPAPPPPIAEITVLSSPLACIGLSLECEANLGERLRKFLVWPERALLALEHERERQEVEEEWDGETPFESRLRVQARPFISYTRTEDGTSVLTEVRVLRSMLTPSEIEDIGLPELDDSDESEWFSAEGSVSGDSEPLESGMPELSRGRSGSNSHTHSLPDTPGTPTGHVPIHWASPPTTPISARFEKERLGGLTPIRVASRSNSRAGHARARSEGVIDLAKLLPRRGSEGFASRESWSGVYSRTGSASGLSAASAIIAEMGGSVTEHADDEEPEVEVEQEQEQPRGRFRCLQLDLRAVDDVEAYHLDKSGLVTRFSDLLHTGGVRMLYSSTTHTANVLVQGSDVSLAERLLRSS